MAEGFDAGDLAGFLEYPICLVQTISVSENFDFRSAHPLGDVYYVDIGEEVLINNQHLSTLKYNFLDGENKVQNQLLKLDDYYSEENSRTKGQISKSVSNHERKPKPFTDTDSTLKDQTDIRSKTEPRISTPPNITPSLSLTSSTETKNKLTHSLLTHSLLTHPLTKNKLRGKRGKITKDDISTPSDFRHVGHVGWDAKGGFDIDNIDQKWKKLFNSIGVTEGQLQDEETCQFIYDFVERHGGIEKAVKEFELPRHPPPPSRAPPPPPCHGAAPHPPGRRTSQPSRFSPAPPPQKRFAPPAPTSRKKAGVAPPPPPPTRGPPPPRPPPPCK